MPRQIDELLATAEACKCQRCNGKGEFDDAEPGDISFRTWVCPACKGTGVTRDPRPLNHLNALAIGLRKSRDNQPNREG